MSAFYDDSRYGIIYRQWFGGSTRSGVAGTGTVITFNETQSNVVKRWYPPRRASIRARKLGVMTLATLGKGEQSFRWSVNATTAAAAKGTIVASTTSAPYVVASKQVTFTLAAGSYLSALASTNVCSTGSVALFLDYQFRYSTGTQGMYDDRAN